MYWLPGYPFSKVQYAGLDLLMVRQPDAGGLGVSSNRLYPVFIRIGLERLEVAKHPIHSGGPIG